MNREEFSTDPLVFGKGHDMLTLAFRDGVSALTETGRAVAFGNGATARSESSIGLAVAFGYKACVEGMVAVALGYHSVAKSDAIAFSYNVLSRAQSSQIAIATGKAGLADALIAISLGEEGVAIAREGGTIAIAFYDQHPGHWESPHGCDPYWVDGDTFLAGLIVSRVGENGILPNHKYALNRLGQFRDMGPADDLNRLEHREF